MSSYLELNRWLHIVIGFIGLTAFWVPIIAQKGGLFHRRLGQVFRYCGFIVVGTACISVTLYLFQLLQAGRGPADYPEDWAFLLFLGYLALATGVMLSHGMAVLKYKKDLRTMASPYRLGLGYLMIFASLFIIAWALYWRPGNMLLLLVLSPLGIGNGWSILTLMRQKASDPRIWLYEHLGAMIGAGIAFHTAFAVFGANRLFNYPMSGVLSILPWVLPAAIGIPATYLWTRHYRNGAKIRA